MKALTQGLRKKVKTAGAVTTFTNSESYFQEKWNMAQAVASSNLIPQQYKNNIADVMMAMELSEQMKMSLFTVTQNLDIIHGKTGWKSTFIIATINSCGRFKSKLSFEWQGDINQDNWGCRAYVVQEDGSKLFGSWVTVMMAKSEGWFGKKGSKWQTMPEQMLQYRAASFFGRLYVPDLLMGLQSVEEVIDVSDTVSKELVDKANELPTVSVNEAVANKEVEIIIEASDFTPLEELKLNAENLGFTTTGPTKGANAEYWLRADIEIEGASIAELEQLGFIHHKDFFVMNVTHLI